MKNSLTFAALTGLAISIGHLASAATVTPQFTTFGSLPQTEFGGDGIPNDAVAITTFDFGDAGTATLGLTATPRFGAAPVTSDGAGTFQAGAGVSADERSFWNISFFADVTGGDGSIDAAGLGLQLLYDFDPGAGTDDSALGILDFAGLILPDTALEGSQNLTFDFFANDALPFITAPSGSVSQFDPFAAGEYSFVLRSTAFGQTAAINVEVSAVPLPASALLLVGGLGAVGALRRRRRAKRD